MSLEEYEKKRNFTKSSEPKPELRPSEKRRFVIQYHDASHLHYDLRLEIEGVLKSWAVPKGLPTRPSVKKLAVQVEDHPIEYLTFEGEIAEGQYGAGAVKIYDTGDFKLMHGGNPTTKLSEGKLDFLLIGGKVQGQFKLIKTKRGNDWLFLAGSPELLNPWIKEFGEASKMPSRITPMKAYLSDKPFDSPNWLFEIKWDGIRAIAYLNNGELSLLSRNQLEQNFRYPELADIGNFILGNQVVLDGEIVALDENGLPSFELLQSRINLQSKTEIEYYVNKLPVVYYVFDVLHWEGRNLMSVPLRQRKKVLTSILIPYHHVKISEWIDEEGPAFYEAAKEQKLEGIVAKNKDSLYVQKRSRDWLKIKTVYQQEFVIGGFTEPRGARTYFGSILLGVYEDSRLVYTGHCGTGFNFNALQDIYDRMKKIEIPQSPFETVPEPNEKAHWIKPQLVAEVKFGEWTNAGRVRQPSFLGLRNDINPEEVIREKPSSLRTA